MKKLICVVTVLARADAHVGVSCFRVATCGVGECSLVRQVRVGRGCRELE